MDIQTLSVMQGIVFVLQVLILFVQYMTNRSYKELGWWAFGSLSMALGILFMPLVNYPKWILLAALSNPLFIGGHFMMSFGLLKFIGKRVDLKRFIVLWIVFVVGYYFFLFAIPNLSFRTILSNGSLGLITLFTAYHLLKDSKEINRRFTGGVFLLSGVFFTYRVLHVIASYPIVDYQGFGNTHILAFVLPSVFSTLWTFGLVLMVNQRLGLETMMEKVKLETVFKTTPDATVIVRFKDGVIVDANKGFIEMMGHDLSEVIGKSELELDVWTDTKKREHVYNLVLKTGSCRNVEVTFSKCDGSLIEGLLSCQLTVIDGERMAVCTVHDITERKRAEEKIRQLNTELEFERNLAHMNSLTDSLTGLANRRMFDEVLYDTINQLKENEKPLSLLMIDIDHFKVFNDKYGHVVGDYALEELGEVLGRLPSDKGILAARYGGEEFAIILPKFSNQEAEAIANSIKQEVESLKIYVEDTLEEANLTVSLGLVTIPARELTYPKDVVVLADKALYKAKENGRNRVESIII